MIVLLHPQVIIGANLESCKYLIQVEAYNSKPDASRPEGTVDGSAVEQRRKAAPAFTQRQTGIVKSAPSDSGNTASALSSKSVARVGLKRRHTVSIDRQLHTNRIVK